MSIAAASLTADDLLTMPEGKNYELIDGELVELKMSQESSWVAGQIHFQLVLFGERANLGWAFPEGTGYACFEDDPYQVRKPDASFVLRSRQPAGPAAKGYGRIAPDLVVEVVSPNDLASEVDAKVEDWLAAGVPLVWLVLPETRSVVVHRRDGSSQRFSGADPLTLPELLPDLRLTVETIFPPRPEQSPTA